MLSKIYHNTANIIKNEHIDSIIELSKSNKPNLYINLPNEYIAIKEYNYIYIKKKDNSINSYKMELKNSIKINSMIIKKVKSIDTDNNNVCRLNSKMITLPLYLRNKRIGDTMEILGLVGHKKVKDIFIDAKVPLDTRKTYPLLVDANDKILWIPNNKK